MLDIINTIYIVLSHYILGSYHKIKTCSTTFAYRILVGKPEGKRPLGRPRRKWVDNIKIDLKEIGWDGMDWMDLAQDRDQ
jgi:hypothetical protein